MGDAGFRVGVHGRLGVRVSEPVYPGQEAEVFLPLLLPLALGVSGPQGLAETDK